MSPADHARDERLQIMLSADELVVLDDFRFKTRMPSRAAAVRELLKRGLAAEGFSPAAFGRKSADYGVTGTSPSDGNEHFKGDGHFKARGSNGNGHLNGGK
jgi:hypothetical protein